MMKVEILDTTLRDGAQTVGINFTVSDKINVAILLDDLGVDLIECGWPGSNPTDNEFCCNPPILKNSQLVAFGMTRRAYSSVESDESIVALQRTKIQNCSVVGKASEDHVLLALQGVSLDENLSMIGDSVSHLTRSKSRVLFDAEHFFDGYKTNPEYSLKCVKTAIEAGAERVILCDTNGGLMPTELATICNHITSVAPIDKLGVHFHNDSGCAVANSLISVDLGIAHIQGTMNGIGERCGNADLCTIIPAIALKTKIDTQIDTEKLKDLRSTAQQIAALSDVAIPDNAPFLGTNAFAHKAGLHASALKREKSLYEHVDPILLNQRRVITLSAQSGLSNLNSYLEAADWIPDQSLDTLQCILDEVKSAEAEGTSFENNTAAIDLLVGEIVFSSKPPIVLRSFSVTEVLDRDVKHIHAKVGLFDRSSNTDLSGQATGNGPVDALFNACLNAVLSEHPILAKITIGEFSAQIASGDNGMASKVQVSASANIAGGDLTYAKASSHSIINATAQMIIRLFNRQIVVDALREDSCHPKSQAGSIPVLTDTFDRKIPA